MKKFDVILLISLLCFIFSSCSNYKKTKENTKELSSEWRDNNKRNTFSYFNSNKSCQKIIGKLQIISRLHKNMLDEGIFAGGMSSRWLKIRKNSIVYFTPDGEIADKGKCQCENGRLQIDWEIRYKRLMEYQIYFNSKDTVELRYYDYPYDWNTLSYDTLKKPTNPTTILGVLIK